MFISFSYEHVNSKIVKYCIIFILILLFIFSSQNTITSNHSELPPSRLSTGATPSGWVESINSPLIQEDGDNKMLKLRFDVSQYEPEEIVVKTVDNKLLVRIISLDRFSRKKTVRGILRRYSTDRRLSVFLLAYDKNKITPDASIIFFSSCTQLNNFETSFIIKYFLRIMMARM